MGHAVIYHACVNLIIGLALLLAWRSDRAQGFAREAGFAFLIGAALPALYLVWRGAAPTEPRYLGTGVLLLLLACAHLVLVLVSCAHLADRPLPRRQALALAAAVLVLQAVVMFGGSQFDLDKAWLARATQALLTLGAGCVATAWLWRSGAAPRASGILLALAGLAQLLSVAGGETLLSLQLELALALRLLLGLALLFAALRRSAQRAQGLHDRFFSLIERSHQGVGVMRGDTTLYANPAARRIYGIDTIDAVASRWRETTIPESERAAARERHRKLMSGELAHAEWEADRLRVDGTPLRLRFSAWRVDWDGEPAEQIVLSDITATHRALQDRLHQATHDELTGAPNRSALLQRLHRLVPAATPFALVTLDIDRFALINEAHGPSVGDEVLRELARRLARLCPEGAEAMRLGEDEFALLLPGPEPAAAAQAVTDALRHLLAEPLPAAGQAFYLDVSMGVVLHPATAADPERLLRAANAAMHEAKQTPGTSLAWAEERFERGAALSLAVEQALRAGLNREAFFMLYQPKVAAAGRRLVGFEALLRWRGADGSMVSPADFIPAAERCGLIVPLGREVLDMVCKQLATWRRDGQAVVPVAVNLSRWQLLDETLVDDIVQAQRRHGIPPELLMFEVTETAAVHNPERLHERAAALQQQGLVLSLDDFGTGLSSLTALRTLPLRELKIDRGLIAPLPDPDACAVVQAVCALAHALGLGVVAEGVETEAQAAAAVAAGCDALQGYLFGRPLKGGSAALQWLHGPSAAAA